MIIVVALVATLVIVVLCHHVWGIVGSTVALLFCITGGASLVSGAGRWSRTDEDNVE